MFNHLKLSAAKNNDKLILALILILPSLFLFTARAAEPDCTMLGPSVNSYFNKWKGSYKNEFEPGCKWSTTVRFQYDQSDSSVTMSVEMPEFWNKQTFCPGKRKNYTGTCVQGHLKLSTFNEGRLVGTVYKRSGQLILNSVIVHYDLSGTN
jgi:hypothetical protein